MKKFFILFFIFMVLGKSHAITAPDFALRDERGKIVKLSDLKQEIVFITFWATTCHSCKRELPEINQNLYLKYNKKVKFYAVVIDSDDQNQIRNIKKQWGFDMPILFGDNDIMEKYRIIGTPITYIIGRDNKIVKIFIGPQPVGKFEQVIIKTLGEK